MGLRLVVPWGRPRAPLLPALGKPSPFYWRRQALLTPTGRASRRRPLRRRIARHRRQPGPRLCPSPEPWRRPLPRSLPRCFLGPRLGSATGERLRTCGITDGDPSARHDTAAPPPRHDEEPTEEDGRRVFRESHPLRKRVGTAPGSPVGPHPAGSANPPLDSAPSPSYRGWPGIPSRPRAVANRKRPLRRRTTVGHSPADPAQSRPRRNRPRPGRRA